MASDDKLVIGLAKVLVSGLKAESLQDVGVSTVPQVISGGKKKVSFRSITGLERERGAIVRLLQDAGISRTVARAIVLLHRQSPLQPRLGFQQVQQEIIRTNLIRRAQYILNAARRLQREADEQKSLPGGSKLSIAKAIIRGLKQEARYYDLHLNASREREVRAYTVDAAASQWGDKLGWHATMDDRTSHECRQAHGKNFLIHKRPGIGWPGMVHPTCRCKAGPPFNTTKTVYGIRGD